MEISKILDDFVKECSKKLNLISIIQFGSSTYAKNPNDIDLVFVFKDMVLYLKEFDKLLNITSYFGKKYPSVSFNMSTPTDVKKCKITIVPLQKADLEFQIDKFFLNFIKKDKNRKVLFGKDPFESLKIIFSKREIIERLAIEINHYSRLKFEGKDFSEYRDFISYFFKSVLRIMLVEEEVSKKGDLISLFKNRYPQITLPADFKNILDHKIVKEDYYEVLTFSKNCLEILTK